MIVLAGISLAVIVLVIIVSLLLRRQLREKYATLWIVIGLVILVLAIFPGLLLWLSDALGVEVPSNLIFALALVLLIGVALHLSWELSLAEDEVRRVAEDVAILRADVEDLRRQAGGTAGADSDDGEG
ncbi:MAG: hypothetical protein ABS62_03075 [Microbacterium sp. SCN 70-200]|uniref:DUF2304 domain-containing protein n=1 Tax=unclassified Microbacterium TaxID=2609290 RepID=UPI00086D14AB|nr:MULTISPECIES: DUF2304 domain-containing protein [unclassified Microbacterium]MBN9213848.1 DUF2304 domain-containing protein [Microbacterium sp.]ODT42400.1 MAG: hypothetical protein ABS62_03075 [Microbacterium sp. SCN 70-200]OJV85472.1 MAG: hypothetical protein BGO46_09190 [Microbacterium sp. 70-16]